MNKHLFLANQIAKLFDNKFKIGPFSFGLDAILGLLPLGGDTISFFFSLYLIWIGYQLKMPTPKLIQMFLNALIDLGLGSIPILGDIIDIFYQANMKNLRILQQHSGDTK